MRIRSLAALIVVTTFASTGAPAASRAATGGLTLYPAPSSGHILFGLVPTATSAATALKAGIERGGASFAQPPELLAAVASRDGRLAIAAFKAAYGGAAVGGLAIATYDESGASRVALLFDRLDSLPSSIGPMERELVSITAREIQRARGTSGASAGLDVSALSAAARSVPLTMRDFPDGTARIGIAQGYTVNVMQSGRFSAAGSDGAYLNIANPIPVLDPSGTMYAQMVAMSQRAGGASGLPPGFLVVPYSRDLGPAWVAARRQIARQRGAADANIRIERSSPLPERANAFAQGTVVQGTETLGGVLRSFVATLIARPPDASGNWLMSVTILSAPAASASRDMPALFAMQRSEQLDNAALMAQTDASIAASANALAQTLSSRQAAYMQMSEAKFAGVMARARATQAGIDRSAAAFTEYINGTTWVHDSGTGRDRHVSQNLGYALAKGDPTRFTELPVRDYTPGGQR